VRIIKRSTVRDFARRSPTAAASLDRWLTLIEAGRWERLADLNRVFPGADEVVVQSGRRVVVFNIGGNNYRLIAAVHYNRQRVFVLRFMTHAEYSKNRWKDVL
jgi:mRNA interferase HigB